MIKKAYVAKNDNNGAEKTWVYVQTEKCLEEKLAVEVFELTSYDMGLDNEQYKMTLFKRDLIEMTDEQFNAFAELYNEGETDELSKYTSDMILAAKVMDTLS